MLSAMRALADRNAATVLAWLDEHAEEALRDGYARNLYAVLSLRRHEPELGRWWMRCAAEVGDLAALPHGAAQRASLKDALVLLEAFLSGAISTARSATRRRSSPAPKPRAPLGSPAKRRRSPSGAW